MKEGRPDGLGCEFITCGLGGGALEEEEEEEDEEGLLLITYIGAPVEAASLAFAVDVNDCSRAMASSALAESARSREVEVPST